MLKYFEREVCSGLKSSFSKARTLHPHLLVFRPMNSCPFFSSLRWKWSHFVLPQNVYNPCNLDIKLVSKCVHAEGIQCCQIFWTSRLHAYWTSMSPGLPAVWSGFCSNPRPSRVHYSSNTWWQFQRTMELCNVYFDLWRRIFQWNIRKVVVRSFFSPFARQGGKFSGLRCERLRAFADFVVRILLLVVFTTLADCYFPLPWGILHRVFFPNFFHSVLKADLVSCFSLTFAAAPLRCLQYFIWETTLTV